MSTIQMWLYSWIVCLFLSVPGLAQAPVSLPHSPPARPGSSGMYATKAITQTAIQTAITSAPANTRLRLAPGTYPLTSSLLIRAKQGLTLDGSGRVTLTGSLNTFITLSGRITNLRITGIRFVSTDNRAGARIDGMITTDQTIQGNGYEVDHCYFTAPTGNFNAICWVPVDGRAGQATNAHVFRNIRIHHNTIDRMGSCGIELLNQNLDRYRIRGLLITDNVIKNCGLQGDYGMGISLSGAMDSVDIARNTVVQCKPYGIEIINCRRVSVRANRISSTIANAAGISINAARDDNGRVIVSERVLVTGNTVSVRYSPIQATDVGQLQVTGNTLYNLTSSDLSNGANRFVRCQRGIFTKNKAISSSYNCLMLNSSPGWQVYMNAFSNKFMTTGGNAYQLIWLYGAGSTGNVIHDNTYEKNKALKDVQRVVWESDGATGNAIK